MPMPDSQNGITADHLSQFAESFDSDPKNRLALNAVTKNAISEVALDRETVTRTDHTFSVILKDNPITSQNRSGRCWLFAALNFFRYTTMEKLNVEKFEFSQNYPMFWDKFEKANYFLESILTTLDEPADSRLVMHLVSHPIQDGGQWDMFANLVKKYGVVPKSAMPETESSSSTRYMNALITAKLREFAAELRRMHNEGADTEALQARKVEMMNVVYRMLCIHLGKPPEKFNWQWKDKDKEFHRDGEMTPQEFYDKYVGFDLDSMACLINCPTDDKPYDKLYTLDYLGNVVEGGIIRYLNVPIEELKRAAIGMLKDGRAVWFGCDVGKFLERDLGVLDLDVYDYGLVYGEDLKSDKAERIDYGQSAMTHAMVFTGVDLDDDGNPIKWRVENSWGKDSGHEGYLVMSDEWFNEYMYEVMVDKAYLTDEQLAVLETEPVVLPPWDPMGALATAE
jgi:bleomycin hydrolase